MTHCPGVPHEGHGNLQTLCPLDHPMHINNVRARRAADEAEQNLFREIAREIDGPPPPGIGALLKQALTENQEQQP